VILSSLGGISFTMYVVQTQCYSKALKDFGFCTPDNNLLNRIRTHVKKEQRQEKTYTVSSFLSFKNPSENFSLIWDKDLEVQNF